MFCEVCVAAIPVTGTELEEVSTQVVVRLDPQARLLETGGKNCKKCIIPSARKKKPPDLVNRSEE